SAPNFRRLWRCALGASLALVCLLLPVAARADLNDVIKERINYWQKSGRKELVKDLDRDVNPIVAPKSKPALVFLIKHRNDIQSETKVAAINESPEFRDFLKQSNLKPRERYRTEDDVAKFGLAPEIEKQGVPTLIVVGEDNKIVGAKKLADTVADVKAQI